MRRAVTLVSISALTLLWSASAALGCETSSWIKPYPSSGGPGTTVTVSGGGFQPGTVVIRWDASAESGGAELAQAQVDAEGNISVEVVVPEDAAGQHKFVAEHTQSSESVAHADAWDYFSIPGAPAADEGQGAGSGTSEAEGSAGDQAKNGPKTVEPEGGSRTVERSTVSTPVVEIAASSSDATAIAEQKRVGRSQRDAGIERDVPLRDPGVGEIPYVAPAAPADVPLSDAGAPSDGLIRVAAVLLGFVMAAAMWLIRRKPLTAPPVLVAVAAERFPGEMEDRKAA